VVATSFYEKLPHKVSPQSPTISGAAKVVNEGTVGGVANPSAGKGRSESCALQKHLPQ